MLLTDARAHEPRAYWGMYGAGKAAAAYLAQCWAEEAAATPLRVNLFDPGAVATRLRAAAMPGEDPALLAQPGEVAEAIAALCLPSEARTGAVVCGGRPAPASAASDYSAGLVSGARSRRRSWFSTRTMRKARTPTAASACNPASNPPVRSLR